MARRRRAPAGDYAAPQTLVEADFGKGIVSDADPEALGPGQLVVCENFMLDKPGKIYKRGGFAYIGDDGGTQYVRVEVAEFPSEAKPEVLAWNRDLNLDRLVAGNWVATGAGANYGPDTGYVPRMHPVVIPDPNNTDTGGALVWGTAAGNHPPRVYPGNGTATRAINAAAGVTNAMGGRYFAYYKSRFVIAASTTYENRMWFSHPGVLDEVEGIGTDNPGAWHAQSWMDFDYGVTGLAALSNIMLVFSRSHFERVSGDTAPPGGNMSHGIVSRTGCIDSRSIGVWNDTAIWANLDGVFMSSGTAPIDLTYQGGIKTLWAAETDGWIEGASFITGAIYRDYYFVTVSIDPEGAGLSTTWILDIPKRTWWRISFGAGVPWWWSWNPIDAQKFYAVFDNARVMDIAPIFQSPGITNRDADEALIEATLRPRPINAGSVGIKNWREGRLHYKMTRADGSPTFSLDVAGRSGTLSASATMDEQAERVRIPFDISGSDEAIELTITNDVRSDLCEIYGYEIDYRPMPLTRGGAT